MQMGSRRPSCRRAKPAHAVTTSGSARATNQIMVSVCIDRERRLDVSVASEV
jgi:hypothetical protein